MTLTVKVGQVWEGASGSRVEILHVGTTHVSVQRGSGVARIPLPDFDPARRRYSLVEQEKGDA